MSARIALGLVLALRILLVWPAAHAQPPAKVPRVGFLSMISSPDPAWTRARETFQQGLREHGYIEGQTIAIEWRFAEGRLERLPALAAELVRLKLDVIVTVGTPAAQAAKQATSTIPIVFSPLADPIGSGPVASLARPGGNITGLSFLGAELVPKRLELLTEAVPGVTRVGVLSHPGVPSKDTLKIMLEGTEAAARALGVRLQRLEAQRPSDFDRAFAAMSRERVGGLVVLPSAMFLSERRRIVDLAAKNRLPAIFYFKEFAEAGGLMSYGPNFPELWRRAATYVAKILKGAKPADLPVEQPMRFEFVINMKTAKALGITFPPTILIRADQVIQ